jgi:signal transduction histidine kinase
MSLAATERGAAGNDRVSLLAARGRRSLGRARSLIDDLFAFAQAGARPLPGAMASVVETVEGVVEELRLPALERGITIAVRPPAASVAVRCASGVLASLLSNLLRNAIKHMGSSARRQVEVRIATRYDRVRFEVEDTGPGLPPELVPQAFDPYVRGAGTSEPGLGLGLATVRRLVEGHDGRYGVSSRPGEGALFWFELPAADAPPPHDDIPSVESFQRQPAN